MDKSTLADYNPANKLNYYPLNKRNVSTEQWTEVNPRVPRVDYIGIHFVNKDTGWACGTYGALIKTTDGGDTWSTSNTNTAEVLLKVRSYNGNIVIASGYNGILLRSTDKGENFTQVTSGVTGNFWGLQMINDTLGWACGTSNSLIKTTDGGITWQNETISGYSANFWWIEFMNENYGYMTGDNGEIFKTTDGGLNWQTFQMTNTNPLLCLDVIDSLHITALGPAISIYSSDAGNSWRIDSVFPGYDISCVKYTSTDTGYITVVDLGLYKTTNQGNNWVGSGDAGDYEMSLLFNDRIGYSVGYGLKVMKANGNLDHYSESIINDDFTGVFFTNDETGWVTSDNANSYQAGVYKTTNGGRSFKRDNKLAGADAIYFIDSLTGFLGSYNYGGGGELLKTTDGGNSWYSVNTPIVITQLLFVNKLMGWAIEGYTQNTSYLLKTTDGGESWISQLGVTGYWPFSRIYFIDSLTGWATTNGDWSYKTTNGGSTWIGQSNLYANDIYYFNKMNGLYINGSKVYSTTDGGNTWSVIIPYTPMTSLSRFGWIDTSHVFVFGSISYETLDQGKTWTLIPVLSGPSFLGFHAPDKRVGYLTGSTGLIYKYQDLSITPVELNSFSAEFIKDNVALTWKTATEHNNIRFNIEREFQNQGWLDIGSVPGTGNSSIPKDYSFIDKSYLLPGNYSYRLKQIDIDGKSSYSNVINVEINTIPKNYFLGQNYPNPFNPTTTISYSLPKSGNVKLTVYNSIGSKVATIANEYKLAGNYSVKFNSSTLASGIYFYRLESGNYTAARKLILIK
jgi:photosystem II stability/assembly factor-like uncharacterized protein